MLCASCNYRCHCRFCYVRIDLLNAVKEDVRDHHQTYASRIDTWWNDQPMFAWFPVLCSMLVFHLVEWVLISFLRPPTCKRLWTLPHWWHFDSHFMTGCDQTSSAKDWKTKDTLLVVHTLLLTFALATLQYSDQFVPVSGGWVWRWWLVTVKNNKMYRTCNTIWNLVDLW